ncbi:MAG: lysoplasmalogenase [Jiangellales bacterium]
MPRPTTMLGVYAAVSVLHVGAHVASLTALTTATKPLLMPALAAFLISASPRPFTRMVRVVLAALAFSWLGDVLLEVSRLADSDPLFMAGLGGFLVAQVLYVVAFTPLVRSSTPPRPPVWALVYVLYGAGLVAFLAPELGEFLLPVAVYAAAICTMGIVASGVNAYTGLGAALFVASDTLIAVGRFTDLLTIAENGQRVLVMTTYLLAQGLIVVGVVVAQRGIWRTAPDIPDSPASQPA